ncbi:MAG: DUF6249 domain-containing protein [Bacteroidota bacterium]|nr:DUF6249 domain-containing protein [Bacteroidota bacterium]
MNEEILIPIFMFGCIALILYKYFDVRHKERMTIIEKGLVNEDLKHLYTHGLKTNPYSSLKYGMLAAFIGVGILVSAFMSQMFFAHEEQITAGIIFLFGGVGLITFYAIAKKRMSEDEKQRS